jgi:uncharacterized membrane protein YjjP (DUF1212 family)
MIDQTELEAQQPEEIPHDQGTLPPSQSRDQLRDTLSLALNAGQLLLENGANTARVEETVTAMALGLGAESIDVFATPTGIMSSAHAGGEHRTKVVRINNSTLLLSRVASVIDLSRKVYARKLTHNETRDALTAIATSHSIYPQWIVVLAVAIACASFAALIGGGWYEIAIAAMASGIAQIVRELLGKMKLNRLLNTAITSAVASGIAVGFTHYDGVLYNASAVISSVLFLAPGVVMMSAIIDLFRGDTVAGMSRAASAILTLVAIAVGIWSVLLASGVSALPPDGILPPLYIALALAFVETVAFAIVFDAPKRSLIPSGIIGIAMYAAYLEVLAYQAPMELAMCAAGFVVGILSEIAARIIRLPASIFSIPGFIAVVPGVLAFRTVLTFVMNDYTLGTTYLVQATLYTGALAAGLGTVQVLARMRYKPLK